MLSMQRGESEIRIKDQENRKKARNGGVFVRGGSHSPIISRRVMTARRPVKANGNLETFVHVIGRVRQTTNRPKKCLNAANYKHIYIRCSPHHIIHIRDGSLSASVPSFFVARTHFIIGFRFALRHLSATIL